MIDQPALVAFIVAPFIALFVYILLQLWAKMFPG